MLSILKRLPFLRKRKPAPEAPARRPALRLESLEERAVPADISVLSTQLEQPTVVALRYNVDTGQTFQAAVYRSADATFDSSDVRVSSFQTVNPGGSSSNLTARLVLQSKLAFDPSRPYVLVVADPRNLIAETDETDNTASFRKLTLGVIAHGVPLVPGVKPLWVDRLGDALEAQGYADTVRLDWAAASLVPAPNVAVFVGLILAQQVRAAAANVATESNDVVDVHFIGHSRGTTVVSFALYSLAVQLDPPYLELGTTKQTLLDPHVARNHGSLFAGIREIANRDPISDVGLFSWEPNSAFSRTYALGVLSFQAAARDPLPFILADEAEVFFQRLPWFLTRTVEQFTKLNLLSEDPAAILNFTGAATPFFNLSPLGIGHYGVPDWYIDNVATV